uniref:VWFD domain-containing protein n=1 Tax=Latimeria chalumnae TaxID=7897 RepID=H3AZ76_LATCH
GATEEAWLSQRGPVGKEFITAFMENYVRRYSTGQFQLHIKAFSAGTSVKVTVNKSTFRKDLTLGEGETQVVTVDRTVELSGSTLSCNTVIIKADKPISVTSLNSKALSTDTTIVYPMEQLGIEYYIITPPDGPYRTFKEIAIVNGDRENEVSVFLKASVVFRRKYYRAGSKLMVSMKAYEVLQLQASYSLSGSRVVAQKPVAVLAGHSCAMKFSKCNHVFEQLLPVSRWGTSFVVPPVPFQTRYDWVFIMTSQNTQLEVHRESGKQSKKLVGGTLVKYSLPLKNPLYITSDVGIQVMLLFNGMRARNNYYDPFFVNIIPTSQFCNSYSLNAYTGFTNYALIVAKPSAQSKMNFDGKAASKLSWAPIADSGYSWALMEYDKGAGSHTMDSDDSFGLYSIGVGKMNGYGSPASCTSGGHSADPCATMKCRVKEACKVVDGAAQCVAESSAVCWAWGDPHYHTFDGKNYDFQGTCTYTIAKNCGSDITLPAFSVEEKNENRGGNTRVAYVRTVKVEVYGVTITVVRSERGRVRVNDMLAYLPITLEDNKVKLYQSGASAIVETDFGLKVSYDWNYHLVITLSSSYFGSVCGLCGNYNGNPSDDFATPGGTLVTTPEKLGASWKVKDGDPRCWDDCHGKCKVCEENILKKYKGEAFCGILAKADGPFKDCHAKINHQIYMDNCAYDLCVNDGYKQFLCQAIKTYADSCQKEAVRLQEWRNIIGCPMDCPGNSHYELNGQPCPATCSDRNAPSKCTGVPGVESCSCNDGYMLSGDKCVRQEHCGCTHEGRYYPPNEKLWLDDKCQRQCTCNPSTGKVSCSNVGCKSGQKCSVVNGIRDCYATTYGTCTALGDPHYKTFDHKKYNFQGTCVYQFAELCEKKDGLVYFGVQVQNNHRGSKTVSYTKLVEVEVYGTKIIISTQHKGKIMVNNILVNLPYYLHDNKLRIFRSGTHAIIQTNFGLQVAFNWKSRIAVKIPSTYAGAVCGLCGNFNGDPKDDLTMKDGQLASKPTAFGQSWKTMEIPGCVHGCKGKCPDCNANQMRQYENDKFCGMITDSKGPFRDCHGQLDPKDYFEDCTYDVCLYNGRADVLCQAISSYASACQEAGVTIYNWRSKTFCSLTCPQNSHYELCADGCPVTCSGLSAPVGCDDVCKEGCQCDEGFVLSGEQCVPIRQCGCVHEDEYYKTGEVFYPSGLCKKQCTCEVGGGVECQRFSCGKNEECKVKDGVQKCQAIGHATCSASGDPHYISFDGKKFDFQGTCTYTLAKSCKTDKHLTLFSVQVENVQWRKRKVAVTKLVAVEVYETTLMLVQGKKGFVKVNGVFNRLPLILEDGKVRVYQHGINVAIETDFGLLVKYDLVYRVSVRVPGNYMGKMGGLCGNYNGDKNDDFMLPKGQSAKDITEFGAAWKTTVPGVSCNDGCGDKCPSCSAERRKIFEKKDYCGFLTDSDGPFKNCHGKVDPALYFEDCIFDTCEADGDTQVLCGSIQSYATACQSEGVAIEKWRSDSFCPLSCPANSHYEICADTCSLTCVGLTDESKCPTECAEGCECDEGFFLDGEECIPMEECGCFENGRYYK